jgi:chromate reductase, NAD(P)H dehydrogenase (quinone)
VGNPAGPDDGRRYRGRAMTGPRHILLISGSLRDGSTNSAVLRTAAAAAPPAVTATLYHDAGRLPIFNPDLDTGPLPGPVAELRAQLHRADGLLFSTPEYAGALPASLKNILEWAVGDASPASIYEKPVAWVNVSSSPTGAADAHRSLRIVLGYVHATIVEGACAVIPVTRDMVGRDGLVADPSVQARLAEVLSTLGAAASPGVGSPSR